MQTQNGRPTPSSRRSGIRISKLTFGMLIVSALLLWLDMQSLGRSRDIATQAGVVQRTLDIANQVERINTSLRKAQAATRGYIISAAPIYLEIFDTALSNLGDAIARLNAYPHSPQTSSLLAGISRTSETIVDLQRELIRVRRSDGRDVASAFFIRSHDHDLISQAERQLVQVRALEAGALSQGQERLLQLEQRASFAVPFTTLTGFLLLLGVYFLARRDLHEARQRQRALVQAHAESEARVAAATLDLRNLNAELAAANDALQAQERRYHHLFEHAEVSIWEEDFSEVRTFLRDIARASPEGVRARLRAQPELVLQALCKLRVMDLNSRSLSLFGATSKADLLEGVQRTFLPESLSVFEAQLCALAEGDRTFVSQAVLSTLSGERRDVLVCITFPTDPLDLHSVPVCLVDVTESARMRAELKRSEERFRSVFEQAADGIFLLTLDLHVLEVNPAGARMLGYEAGEMIQMRIQDLLAPHEWARPELEADRLAHAETHAGEWEHRRRDGSTFPAEVDVRRIAPGTRMAVVRDISARRQADQERRRHGEELQALSAQLLRVQEDERRALALELHDELGQKLAVLRITLAAMMERVTDGTLRSGMRDMFELASELVAQVRSTALNLRPAMLDTEGLVNTLAWHIREQSRIVGIPISFHAEPMASRLDPLLEVAAFRMVQESLNNAIKHASARQIEVRMQLEEDHLLLQVRDDGIGFTPETRGTGSGLAGIHDRAMLLGGRVTLSSAPGEGTCIDIDLPTRPQLAGAWY